MHQIRKTLISVGLFICLLVLFPLTVQADLYKYRDKNGVLHFSDTKRSKKYRLYHRHKTYRYYSSKKYDHYLTLASSQFGVSFSLLKAVIKVESDFNPHAISKKGALGLMQIMPANFKRLRISNPFDPWENIMGGAYYLGQLLNRFNGNITLALAAYNAGENAVNRYNDIPPYPETINYVEKVLRYYNHFKKG